MFCLYFVVFYAFSGTNLLTRCHSVSSLFSAVFVFQKSYTGNILGIGRNKDQNSYFSRTKDEDRTRAGGEARGQPHPRVARPLARTTVWCGGPGPPLTPPLRLYIKPSDGNPKTIGNFLEEVPQLRRRHRRISGDRSLCSGTLPGRGSAPRAISIDAVASTAVSIDFTAISTNVDVSYDEEGVVLPRG
jgi:hypothetical protein